MLNHVEQNHALLLFKLIMFLMHLLVKQRNSPNGQNQVTYKIR
jgi:hypothetical protein